MRKINLVLQRLWQIIPVLLGISIITFTLAHFIPGDPVRLILGPRAPQDVIDAVREQYGLNKPLVNQYFIYMRNLLEGDWGTSIAFKSPVLELIGTRFTPTLYLLIGGLVFSIIPTLILSILASSRPDGWLDQVVRVFYTVGLGLPSFWLAIVFVLIFAVRLGWLPATGFGDTFREHIQHMLLPWVTVSVAITPILTRNLRATLLEKQDADFVVAGKSKGLPKNYIFWKHTFPNSVLPSLHLLGVMVLYILGSSIVLEPIFAIPGLGQLYIRSVIGRDYFVIQAMTLVFATITILGTLTVDLLTVIIDPRIKG